MMASAASGKPRILVLSSTYPRWAGDDEPRFVHQLCEGLARDFEVSVVTPHAAGAAREETLDGVEVRRFRYAPAILETLVHKGGIVGNLRAMPWKVLLLPSFLLAMSYAALVARRRLKPHVAHAHWCIPGGVVSALAFRDLPFVVTAHGSDVLALPAWPWTKLRRWIGSRAAALTAVGTGVAAALTRETGRQVRLMPMGVSLRTLFVPDPAVLKDSARVLYVGRLIPSKRVDEAISAMALLRRTGVELTLEIVGDGPDRPRLETLVRSVRLESWVRFVPREPQELLVERYRRAAVTLVPSGGSDAPEGLALVAVEALGSGCAVVSAPNPALTAVLPAGAPIVFCRGGNAAALADGIRECLRLHGTDSVDGPWRKVLAESLDWTGVTRRYSSLFRDIIRSGRLA